MQIANCSLKNMLYSKSMSLSCTNFSRRHLATSARKQGHIYCHWTGLSVFVFFLVCTAVEMSVVMYCTTAIVFLLMKFTVNRLIKYIKYNNGIVM